MFLSFRVNLRLDVRNKSGDPAEDIRSIMEKKVVRNQVKMVFNGPTIIYCQTKKVLNMIIKK